MLRATVVSVRFGASQKQMIWIHARRVVALMTDAQAVSRISGRQKKGYSVGKFSFFSNGIPAVTVPVDVAGPSPATLIVRRIGFAPKPFSCQNYVRAAPFQGGGEGRIRTLGTILLHDYVFLHRGLLGND
jgi:hypothetical protein